MSAGGATATTATRRRPLPPLTEAHEELRLRIRAWVAAELTPHVEAWEQAGSFPDDVIRRCGAAGWLGLKFPVEDGGADDPVGAVVFAEELARCGSGGLAAGIGAHAGIALPPIARFGTPEQRERYLRPGIRGELIAALGITEPDAGSDVASIRTHARRVEGGWVLNGAKLYITNGMRADVIVTAVRSTAAGGHHGISFLLVERGAGVTSAPLRKLGWHASDTALITFDDVAVPEGNLLGPEHEGFRLIMENFAWERVMMAIGAVAAAELALERTCAVVAGAGGAGQETRHALAEAGLLVEQGRALTYHALRLHLAGGDAVAAVTAAKLATQRAAFEVADACLAAIGPDPALERAVRDLRLGPIGGGTDEIMRELLGRTLGL